jgi:hypothetical protein
MSTLFLLARLIVLDYVAIIAEYLLNYELKKVSFEMWRWRRMQEVVRTNRVKNEVLPAVRKERNILHVRK